MTHYSLRSYDNLQGECYSTSIDEPCWGAAVLSDIQEDTDDEECVLIHLCEGHFNGAYEISKKDNYDDVVVREI